MDYSIDTPNISLFPIEAVASPGKVFLFTIPKWSGRQYSMMAMLSVPFILSFHPKSTTRRALYFLPLILIINAYRTPNGTNSKSFSGDYQFGLLLASWTMRILDRFYLNDPEATFLRKEIDDKPGRGPITYNPIKKFIWGLELIVVTRGIGWNWQISQIPPQRNLKRGPFLSMKLRKACFTYLGLCFVISSSQYLLALARFEEARQTPTWASQVLLHPIFLYCFIYTSWAFVVYGSLSLGENLLAIAFVGLRITKRWSEPSAWPSLFGSIREGYGFRRSWSSWWHQNCRRTSGTLGHFLVRNIPYLRNPQTKAAVLTRRYLQVICTFLVSAVIHAGGSIYISQKDGVFSDGGSFKAFLIQAAIIVAEDVVLWLLGIADGGNPSTSRRLIGYILVHSYAAYAIPTLKVMPLARDHGIEVGGHPLMAGVKMAGMGARGILRNPYAALIGPFNA
ncbi:MAG: hypothetical protein M1839_005993 [Geoglossum umbratile]|nr:MAG: hypothetical protein M1839_005993 [Geoglossum umbratile]